MKLTKTYAAAFAVALFATQDASAQNVRAATPVDTTPPVEELNPYSRDTQVWYRVQPFSKEPGINNPSNPKQGKDITKQLLHFEHIDTGGLIYNSISVTALFSNSADPNKGGASGAQEIYATYRGDISAANFGYQRISFPGVKDVQFEFGGDLNAKNTAYAPGRRFLLVGPNFVFDVRGSVNLAIHFAKEWNNNGYLGRTDSYNPTLNTELSYTQPLEFTGLPLRLEGVFNVTLPKGTDVAGNKTRTEYYSYNSFIIDLGEMVKWRPHTLDLFTGVQLWVNKFGLSQKNDGGAFEVAPYVGIGIHF